MSKIIQGCSPYGRIDFIIRYICVFFLLNILAIQPIFYKRYPSGSEYQFFFDYYYLICTLSDGKGSRMDFEHVVAENE